LCRRSLQIFLNKFQERLWLEDQNEISFHRGREIGEGESLEMVEESGVA